MRMNNRGNNKSSLLIAHLSIFCFAFYPILAVYAYNADQLHLSQILLPLAFSLLIGYIALGSLYLLFRNILKASLGTVILLLLFWNYRLLYDLFTAMAMLPQFLFLIFILVLYAFTLYLLNKKTGPDALKQIHTIVIIPVIVLIIFNLYITGRGEVKKLKSASAKAVQEEVIMQAADDLPDIYILIFDEFAAPASVSDVWGYDHNAFVTELEEQGFFFARNSKTRFPFTHLSIPGIMNLEYPEQDISRTESLSLYNNNQTFRFLNQSGYQIYFLDGWGGFEYTFNIPVAELVCFYDTSFEPHYRFDDFSYMLMGQSMLASLTEKWMKTNANHYYLGHHFFLDYIEQFPARANALEQPGLLYAHVMAPHLPYVFDRHGNFNVNPTNYWEYRQLDPALLRDLYFEQYLYVSNRITSITESILKNSLVPPVILLFSDHGPRLESAGVAGQEHHHRVLNAVFFPDEQYHALYDNISPVNTMRVLFNKYFDTDYDMLNEYSFQ